jgi:hypothetical protein
VPTATFPPRTATPDGQPTPDLWATIVALPTATPGASDPWNTSSECKFINGRFTCGDIFLRGSIPIDCPINVAFRQPYPRSLVSERVQFQLLPADWYPSEVGAWTTPADPDNLEAIEDDDDNPIGLGFYKRMQLGLRSERLPAGSFWPPPANPPRTVAPQEVPKVLWNFTGRAGNGEPNAQYGISGTYSYAAASYSGPDALNGSTPSKGRRFDFVNRRPGSTYDLPAYAVAVKSYCGFWYAIKGMRSAKYWMNTSSCRPKPIDPRTGLPYLPALTNDVACPPGQYAAGDWKFYWQEFQTQWEPKDMREESMPNSFLTQLKTTGGGTFAGREYREPERGGVWVPVVEVQTVQQ